MIASVNVGNVSVTQRTVEESCLIDIVTGANSGFLPPVVGTTCADSAYLPRSRLIGIVMGADSALLPPSGGASWKRSDEKDSR